MQKRVLLVSNMYPSADQIMYGVYIKNIEEALREHEFHVSRVVISGRGKNFLEKLYKYFSFYKDIFSITPSRYDVIDINYPSHSFFPFFFKRRGAAKYIVRLHGHDLVPSSEETWYFRIIRCLTLLACKRADGIIVPSDFFRRELLRLQPDLEDRVLILPAAGVNPEQFRPLTQALRNPDGTICFGYVGRLDPMKGVELFIRALAAQPEHVHGLVVGEGPDRDCLLELSNQLQISHRCQFIGAIPHNQLPEYYGRMDALVFPTLYRESFGLVMIEAMACGVPVITTDHGATGDFVADGIDGHKVAPGDLHELVNVMRKFTDLPSDERCRLAENAVRKASHYTMAALVARYQDFIERLGS